MRGLALLLMPTVLLAQNIITTVAGSDAVFPRPPLRSADAPIGLPGGLALDTRGNLFIADTDAQLVIRAAADGNAEVAAGTGIPAFNVNIGENIPATRATLAGLRDIAIDSAGNILVLNNGTIRRIAPDGTIATLVGEGVTVGGLPTATRILPDNAGGIYVVESFQHRIRRLSAGSLTVIAGTGEPGFSGDNGPANRAELRTPTGIALDAQGNLYVADSGNGRLRRIDRTGVIRTVPGAQYPSQQLLSVTVEPSGSVLFGGRWLRRLNQDGSITSLIGERPEGFGGDGGPAVDATISAITGIAASASGDIFFSDSANRRVRRIDRAGRITTHAGNGIYRFRGDGGPAEAALFSSPAKITADAAGNIYVADFGNRRYRRISANGNAETLAGLNVNNVTADSAPALVAPFTEVNAIAVDGRGQVYMTDSRNNRVRRLGSDGRVTTFAGNGSTAALNDPVAIAVAPDGSVYVGEGDGNRVRRIAADGSGSRIFAGTGVRAATGDGGPAANAAIESVFDLAVDRAGTVYISTVGPVETNRPSRIRVVGNNGIIRTVAGTPQVPLASAGVYIAIGPDGVLYYTNGCAVFRLTAAGQPERIAGMPLQCSSEGDGIGAFNALLGGPRGIAFDGQGNLVIAEGLSHRVRKILAQTPSVRTSVNSLSFSAGARGPSPPGQSFTLSGSITNLPFSITVDDGGRRWLVVEDVRGVTPRIIDVTVDPERVAPGTHEGTIRIETPTANPASATIRVRFEAGPLAPPSLQIDRPSITFAYPREPVSRRETVMLSNAGSGVLPLSINARTSSGGSWLQVRPANGTVTPQTPLQVTMQADSTGLSPGTYTGAAVLSLGSITREIPVTMMVSDADHAILLSQSGLSFTAVQTGGTPPAQDFAVINLGTGSMAFQANASTLSGGNWLSVNPGEGVATAGAPAPLIQVSINHAGLAPGRYYGQVRVDSGTAANSPHTVTVNLEVLAPNENPGAVIQPAELSFEPTVGGAPGAKEVTIHNLTPNPVSFRSRAFDVAIIPRDAIVEPNRPLRMIVQPTTLDATSRSGVFLQFSDGVLRGVPVFLRPDQSSAAASKPGVNTAGGCTPKLLVPSMVSLGQASTVPAGWPAALSVEVKDDCGQSMEEGSVTVSFSNGDPSVSLQSLRDGRWQGTWQSRGAATDRVVLRVEAEQPNPSIRGVREVSADLRASQDPPAIAPDGIVSASSPVAYAPQSQGGLVSLNGERLTDNVTQSPESAPWPTQLGGTEALIGARRIPLGLASPGQLTGILPGDIAPNTTHQILVRRGTAYSRPVAVNVAAVQPGILTATGSKQAIATVVRGDERQLNSVDFPARAGDTIIVICSGLGATDPAVAAGEAAPEGARVNAAVSAKIGDASATVSSAVMTAGSVGTYQVTITVPDGAATGDSVPLVIEAAGQTSVPATLVVR